MSILDDESAMAALTIAGRGLLILNPAEAASIDDARIERVVIRMIEGLKEIGEAEEATWVDFMCATLELSARIIAAGAGEGGKRSAQRKLADDMAKNLRTRILGLFRDEVPGQEQPEN